MTLEELLADLQRPWHHGEHVDARGITLDAPLVLDGMEVRGFDLSGAVLNGGLSARGTVFRGLTWLRGAMLHGPCDLSDATFRTDLRADKLTADAVDLTRAHVQGVVSLAGASIGAVSLNEALLMANVTLEGARITGTVDLADAEIMGGLWSAGARIGTMQVEAANISGRLRLTS